MVIFKNLTNVKFQQLKNAVGKDKNRTNLHGVFLDVNNEKIVVSNGKTIFAYDVKIEAKIEEEEEFNLDDIIIDPKVFNQDSWLSVPKEDVELVEFWVHEDTTQIVLGGEVVAIANNILHEQPFPKNWKSVLKLDHVFDSVQIDPALLKSALSCVPKGCIFPTISFGNKVLITSSRYNEEVESDVHVVGCTMPLMFDKARIYDVSERFILEGNDVSQLIGKELSKRVFNTWNEDFVNEDNGEVVSIERNEIILDRETIIDGDSLAVLKANNVKEVFILKDH